MGDAHTTIAELRDLVRAFAAERRWEPFHSPKNLAMALAVEAAELMEPMMWLEADASRRIADDPARREHLGEELADVFNLLLNLCNALGIDLSDAFRAKLVKNAIKYPAPTAG
jgi:NTP pyrophosphatase (non-canonical NTP hydrolase)